MTAVSDWSLTLMSVFCTKGTSRSGRLDLAPQANEGCLKFLGMEHKEGGGKVLISLTVRD